MRRARIGGKAWQHRHYNAEIVETTLGATRRRSAADLFTFRTSQRERAAPQRHVLAEVDHVMHPLLRVFFTPEIVNDWRNGSKERDQRRGTLFRFSVPERGSFRPQPAQCRWR